MDIPSELSEAGRVEDRLLKAVTRYGYSKACVFGIRLALEEGLSNAIKHGNRGDRHKSVEVSFDVNDERVLICIRDQGEGFDPSAVPDPTADENLEKPSGRGIMLMRAYMDELTFRDRGKQVCMVKRKNEKAI